LEFSTKPWLWIGLIYGSQSLGAILVTWLFGINMRETIVAILLLVMGTALALFFLYRPPRPGKQETLSLLLPTLIYCLFIFYLSSKSFDDVTTSVDTDLFHPVEYATLGILLCWNWQPVLKRRGVFPFILGVLSTGMLYGITDELHQSFVSGRDADMYDLVLDIVGLSLGCLAFLYGSTRTPAARSRL